MADDPTDRPSPGTEAQPPIEVELPEFEHLELTLDGGIATVEIRRPKALNALNGDLLAELAWALDVAEADVRVGAVILAGAGRAFVAGADIGEIADVEDAFTGREHALAGQALMNAVAAMPLPTIAAIHGFALGGGLELALACDLRVAGPDAKLGLPEVGLGLIPGYGGTQRLPRLIGRGRALDLIFTARHVDAEEALALGLVNRVADDPRAAARELAEQILRNGPVALGLAKEAVDRGLDVSLDEGLEIEADLFGLTLTTDDKREGTSAFLEKRRPEFEGR